jgi:hypothetical protein
MKTFCAALLLVAGCSREPQAATNTIAPAESRPAPTDTSSLVSGPVISTAGSPPPASAAPPGTTFVTVRSGRIDVQRLLPRAHTAFHIANQTDVAHQIVVRGGSGSSAGSLPAKGRAVVQLLLGTGVYEIACMVPGHRERAQFETYRPGVPLEPASERVP